MTQEVYCFLASAARKAYTIDVVNVICFPENSTYRLRYREKYIFDKKNLLKKLKELSKKQDSEKKNCLFFFFDKDQVKDNKIKSEDLVKAFVPIRWCSIKAIIETKAFIQIEIILGGYFDLESSPEVINTIDKISKHESWEGRIDSKYNSFKYFIFPIQLPIEKVRKLQTDADWKDVCNELFKYDHFKSTIFQIFRRVVDFSDDETVKIQEIREKLRGYQLKPGNFYALEIVQYIDPEFYPSIEKGILSIHMPKEHIRQVENEIEIIPGGPYIFYSSKFYTRETYGGCLGLLGISIKDLDQRQQSRSRYVLCPQITVPLKINPSRKGLILPALLVMFGIAIAGCGIIFDWDIGVEYFSYLLGTLLLAVGTFLLATLEGRS